MNDKFLADLTAKIEEYQVKLTEAKISYHPILKDIKDKAELVEMSVAQTWGKSPSELRKCPYVDKVAMYAWYIAIKEIDVSNATKSMIKRNSK